MSIGMTSGQSGSNSDRWAPGAVHRTTVSPNAQGVGLDVRGDDRQRAEHDAEVLGDVAQVLDRPVGVVAERRVAVRLELVLVVVARVQPGAGGELRVHEERRHRDDARRRPPTRKRRARVPPPPTRMKNGAANTSGRRAVAAMPSSSPASTCEPSSGQTSDHQPDEPPPSSARGRPSWASPPSIGSSRASSVSARGSWRSATPTASRAAITATRWARYQVLPTAAAHHQTVPVANRIVVSARTASRIRRPAEHPPRDADADRRQGGRDRLLVHGQPDRRDERQQDERGQGRERQQHLARRLPVGVEQRVDVVEVPVRGPVRAVGDRPVERNLSVQEGVRLPDEMVVLVVVLGVGPRVQHERAQREQQPDDDRREAAAVGPGRDGREGAVGALGYTPVHLQRCV